MKNIIVIFVVLILAVNAYALEVGKIVAKVNKEVITAKDLDDYYNVVTYSMPEVAANLPKDESQAKKQALERLIEDKLILAEAKKLNLEIFPYLIDNQLKKIMASYRSRQAFENSLVEKGINITLLRERIKGQYLMRQLITDKVSSYVTVSPQEIRNYYQEHADTISSGQKYLLWAVKTKNKNLLSQITKDFKANGFAQAKNEHKDDFVHLEAQTSDLNEEIANALKALKEGEFVVRKVGEEHYFIYLEKIIPAQPLSLEEASEKIYNIIWDKKFKERFQEWIKELKSNSVISVYL